MTQVMANIMAFEASAPNLYFIFNFLMAYLLIFLFFSVLSLVLNTAIHADSILTLNLFKRTIQKEGGRREGEKVVVGGKGLGRPGAPSCKLDRKVLSQRIWFSAVFV